MKTTNKKPGSTPDILPFSSTSSKIKKDKIYSKINNGKTKFQLQSQ